ncbi:MAG: prephenate dehydrogenase/arogenate dehydrogenase family protein [Candidatus Micrarchaeia archaeon]
MRIAVVGGAGALGSLYARLFKEAGFQVTISDADAGKARKVAGELGIEFADSNEEAAANADAVIISVPISETVRAVRGLLPHLRRECLLMDFTSVKTEAVREMTKAACEEVVGCHPMHGPRVASLDGQMVVFTPVRKGGRFERIKAFFAERGASIVETTPEEHDRMVAVVQALTHFSYITTAATLKELGADVRASRKFASPVYELTMDLVARIIGQDPHLYADIQMHNPFAKSVRAAFVKQAARLRKVIEEKDKEGFIRLMTEAAKNYGNLEDGMAKSDKAIGALYAELNALRASVGRCVGLENIYSRAVHYGRLESVTADTVEIMEGKTRKALKLANVRVLGEDELREWKMKRATYRDYSFLFPSCEPEAVRAAGSGIDEDILKVEVIDTYQLKEGKSVTLRFHIYADADAKKIGEKIAARYAGLGAKLR